MIGAVLTYITASAVTKVTEAMSAMSKVNIPDTTSIGNLFSALAEISKEMIQGQSLLKTFLASVKFKNMGESYKAIADVIKVFAEIPK